MKKVYIFEFQDIRFASRARKEAFTLSNNGFDVTLIGFNQTASKKKIYFDQNVRLIEYSLFCNHKKSILHKFIAIFIFNLKLLPFFLFTKADIYHAHDLKFIYLGFIGKAIYKGKLIYDAHELHVEKRKISNTVDKFFRNRDFVREKKVIKRADIIIQANLPRAKYFSKIYKTPLPLVIENHEVIFRFENNNTKTLRETIGVREKIIIIFTGNVSIGGNQKVDNIIKAMEYLSEDFIFCTLGSVTDYTKKQLLKISNSINVQKRVFFLPPVLSESVVPTISSADLAIIPIYANCLNSEFSALNKFSQSLMAGLPIVCSDYENIKDIIFNNPIGQVGDVFDVENPISISEAVVRCSVNNDSYKSMKQNASLLAHEYLNWDVEGKKLIKAYNKML